MKKTFRQFMPGTAEYVVEHARYRASRGKSPAAAFGDIRNPRKALLAAMNLLNTPGAVVREINGQLVLEDPVAFAMIRAIHKHNCWNTLEINAERVQHFKLRVTELGHTASDVVIVLLNVDDQHGGPLAEALMPGASWDEIRGKGQIPFARGIAMRRFIQDALGIFDEEAAMSLQKMTDTAVVVVDHGVAEVFPA